MTHRERELLAFLGTYMSKHGGVAPTLQEMADGIGIKSKSGVHAVVASLVRQGLLRRTADRHRAIAIVDNGVDLATASDDALMQEVIARGLMGPSS